MADNNLKYDLNNLFTMRSNNVRGATLAFGAFAGRIQMTVWNDRQPIFRTTIDPYLNRVLQAMLLWLLKEAGPGDARAVTLPDRNSYDKETKVITKTLGVIQVEITDKKDFVLKILPAGTEPYSFKFEAPFASATGDWLEDRHLQGKLSLETLISILRDGLPMAEMLSSFNKPDPAWKKKGGSDNRGESRGSGGSNQNIDDIFD